MYIEQDELVGLLLAAVDEAEGWYDEARGMEPGQRLSSLAECYAVLDAKGVKTKREQAENTHQQGIAAKRPEDQWTKTT
jgi:hypothetical protein